MNVGYELLSESTLWTIFKMIKPSQRKSLAGLDDIIDAGMNRFDVLEMVSKGTYCKYQDLTDALQRGKRYLKTCYQLHCSIDSEKIYLAT